MTAVVIVNGRPLLPGGTFVARNRISGRCCTYTYRGTAGRSRSGELWVAAVDRRGLVRTVALDAITLVHRRKKVAS